MFWFGKRFETPLLVQSILMNVAMFALIQLCVTINNKVRVKAIFAIAIVIKAISNDLGFSHSYLYHSYGFFNHSLGCHSHI